jgi:uncharacterized repeat protein (TIGR01451 family)
MNIKKLLKLFFAVTAGLALAAVYLAILARPVMAEATIRYAKPGGSTAGACDSWANACDLQVALTSAISGTEIWVAHGVYTPGLPMTATFQLKTGVALYGGFAMTETERNQRNWQTNLTVLSGDIDNNDTTDPNGVVTDTDNIHGNNAYHVVNGSGANATAILDGFTATAGKANSLGGGMYISSGGPTIQNISFTGNYAASSGGGMSNEGNPVLFHVIFTNNTSPNSGGGLSASGNPLLTDVDFIGNEANTGGGFYAYGSYNHMTIFQARFTSNRAYSTLYYTHGGGMYTNMGEGSSLTMTNVIFNGNTSVWYGGGMVIAVGDIHMTNVLFFGNRAGVRGGGMSIYQTAPEMTNVTFSGNWSNYGGGIYLNAGPLFPLNITNSIFWGNDGLYGSLLNKQIYIDAGQVNATYSDIQGGYAGTGNINLDPQFVMPITATVAPTTTGDYHLQITSPVIDAGDNTTVTIDTDLDGNPRKIDVSSVPDTGYGTPPIVDMGVYEAAWPVADAGEDQIVKSGILVTLDGSDSTDPAGNIPLTYGWNQTGGTPVVLSSAVISQPTFTAPDISAQTGLTFTLVVTNSIGQVSTPDEVIVTVVPILADVSVSLTDNITYTVSGNSITYILVVNNTGPDDAIGVLVTDTLPVFVSQVSWTCIPSPEASCPGTGDGLIHATVDLAAGSVITFTINGQVAPGIIGNLVHTTRVTFSGDPNPLNNYAMDSDILYVRVFLPIMKK